MIKYVIEVYGKLYLIEAKTTLAAIALFTSDWFDLSHSDFSIKEVTGSSIGGILEDEVYNDGRTRLRMTITPAKEE